MARYNLKTGRCSHGGMASYPNSGGAHCRSQSMPEAVYFQHMVGLPIPPPPPPQRPPSHGAFVPFKESNSTTLLKPSRRPYSSGSGLRRSQTNVGDLRKGRLSSATGRFGSSQYLAPNWTMEDMHYSSAMYAKPHELFLPARSRSNIASLYANGTAHAKDIYLKSLSPPVYQHRSMGFLSMIPEPIARNTVRQTQSCRDVNKPLHVDCSVEYDLGHQPKIPKDSAPLLIIHPEYQAMKYGSQLDSGPSSPNSYIDRAQSSPHTPIRPPPLHEGITQSVPLSKSAAMGPSRNRITRHCSFLDSTFNGMPPSSHGSQLLSNNTSLSSTSTSSSKLLRTKSKAAASCKEATALREREQRQLNQILHYQPLATQQHQQQQHNQPHSHHPNHPDVLFEVVAAPSLAIQTPRDNVGRSRQPHRRASRSLWAMDNSDEQGFHLSLPELNPTPSYPNQASQDFTEENSHQPSTGDSTSNGSNSSQTQRLPPSKARLNLSTKLAATQKSSLGSKDSAFMMMNSEDSSSPGSNYEMNDMAGYDSGLGTPSSLTIAEGDEGSSPHHRPDQSSHRTATASSGMSSKWKSSMTGLVNGILCCSGGILASSSKSKMATYTVTATFHPPAEIFEDSRPHESSSSPATMTQYQASAKDFKASSILSTMSSLSSTSTMSGDYHPWSPQLSSSPPYTTSIPEESESESGIVCPTCHSSLADCRDGFCASVWTRKDRGERSFLPMHRPIQI